MKDHVYIVTYDIRDPKRWKRVFKTMNGFGEWLQLSVFQCRLSAKQHAELIEKLNEIVHHLEDHVLLMDLGPYDNVKLRVTSLGEEFKPVTKEPIIV